MIELTLYTRAGCHLCDEMKAGLAAFPARDAFRVTEVEVSWDGPFAERYGGLLPVLARGETEICHYFLDQAALLATLSTNND